MVIFVRTFTDRLPSCTHYHRSEWTSVELNRVFYYKRHQEDPKYANVILPLEDSKMIRLFVPANCRERYSCVW